MSQKIMNIQTEINNSENRTPHSELPKGWKWVKVGEVCVSTENRDPRTTPDLSFKYVDISSVDNRSKRIIEARTILGKDAPTRARQVIKANDVLVATTRPNLNAVAFVSEEFDNEICSTGFCVLRPTETIDPRFLFMFVETQYFVETISGQVKGMLYPAVTDNQIHNVYMPFPPLSEQHRIALKLQDLMQEVERARIACEKQLEAANSLPSAYLREVFESEEAKKWERKRLREVCELIRGTEPGTSYYNLDGKGYKFIRVSDISKGRIQNLYTTAENVILCNKEDLLMALDGSPGAISTGFEGAIASGIRIIRPKIDGLVKDFLYWALQTENVQKVVREYSFGSTIQHASKSIQYIEIPLPPLSEQHLITSNLKQKMAQVEKLQSAIRNQQSAIDALPQAILRKAFRGEL